MKTSINKSELIQLIKETTEELVNKQNNLTSSGLAELYTPIVQLSAATTLKILEKLDIIEIK
ncbi:hypothetical protein [Turicibacter sanguinis]|uniref:hypothetical protein n=1 Tax=Turicibacter sanguinis TaxID=154288 RepID=UPI0018AC532B|nr:hypothetical protein [Turicibacter sanguinis]MDB8553780.1 hypothetical protein [Turicibacter sanguinis]